MALPGSVKRPFDEELFFSFSFIFILLLHEERSEGVVPLISRRSLARHRRNEAKRLPGGCGRNENKRTLNGNKRNLGPSSLEPFGQQSTRRHGNGMMAIQSRRVSCIIKQTLHFCKKKIEMIFLFRVESHKFRDYYPPPTQKKKIRK